MCLVKDVYCMFYMVTVAQFDEPWSSYVRKNTHLVLAVRERHCVAGQKQSGGLFLASLGKIYDFSGYVQRGVAQHHQLKTKKTVLDYSRIY